MSFNSRKGDKVTALEALTTHRQAPSACMGWVFPHIHFCLVWKTDTCVTRFLISLHVLKPEFLKLRPDVKSQPSKEEPQCWRWSNKTELTGNPYYAGLCKQGVGRLASPRSQSDIFKAVQQRNAFMYESVETDLQRALDLIISPKVIQHSGMKKVYFLITIVLSSMSSDWPF